MKHSCLIYMPQNRDGITDRRSYTAMWARRRKHAIWIPALDNLVNSVNYYIKNIKLETPAKES